MIIFAGNLILAVNFFQRKPKESIFFENHMLEGKAPSWNTCNKIGYPRLNWK
jgi:hypothetical protein